MVSESAEEAEDEQLETTLVSQPESPASAEPQQSKSRVRGRLMQASRREADARMEADMLAADIAELTDQLQHAMKALKREQQHRKWLEQANAARDAKILQLQADLQAQADDISCSRSLQKATERAERAESAVAELQQQLALVDRPKPSRLQVPAARLQSFRKRETQHAPLDGQPQVARHLWAPKNSWPEAQLLSNGSPGTAGGQGVPSARVAEARPPQAPAADVLLLQGALRQAHDTSQRLLRQRASRRQHTATRRSWDQPCSVGDTETSTAGTADDLMAAPAVTEPSLTACQDADGHSCAASRRRRRHRGSRERPLRPATASPAGIEHPSWVSQSLDTARWSAGAGTGGHHRSTSPSQQMRQLLTQVDSHITHARMLAAPPRSPPPNPPSSPPACPVNITIHGAPGNPATVGHGEHGLGGTGSPPHQHVNGEPHQATASARLACQGSPDCGTPGHHMMLACGCPQPGDFAGSHEQNSDGRRSRLASRTRMSASNIIPPHKVAAEALRQARIDYFADVQRIKQKRLQDWGQMFGQVP